MPVIETETITRRKIVKGVYKFPEGGEITVLKSSNQGVRLSVSLAPHDSGQFFYTRELREAAALFTEMADILEKGE